MWLILEKVPCHAEKKQKDGFSLLIHSASLCPFIGLIYYVILKYSLLISSTSRMIHMKSREEILTLVGEYDIQIDMRVPQEAVKLIIGGQRANIKRLRKQTGARIDVDMEDVGNVQVLLISGFPVQGHERICTNPNHTTLTKASCVPNNWSFEAQVMDWTSGEVSVENEH
ncbi:tudor and KH domain-containing protein [Cricetulus griseus]|nr:tudor and KH domain-containing protein [Cricetulus griseus]